MARKQANKLFKLYYKELVLMLPRTAWIIYRKEMSDLIGFASV